jgi:hypothetical protein
MNTMTVRHWAYRDSVQKTAEQAVIDQFLPDITAKTGIHESTTVRAAVRSGGDVRRALLAQIGHQGVIDYINGRDCYIQMGRYEMMVEPNNVGRAH